MNNKIILEAIKTRRSIRKFRDEIVPDELIFGILEAGIWAPSGLNNQPWRFIIIREKALRESIAPLTKYSKIISSSDFCIAVFYHLPSGYDRDKDLMAIGSCIQNMMLYAHSCGIGSVWLGEILRNKKQVNEMLDVDECNECMALVAFGYPAEDATSERRDVSKVLLKSFR